MEIAVASDLGSASILRPSSPPEVAHEHPAQAILSRRLQSPAPHRQVKISEQFGIIYFPVREPPRRPRAEGVAGEVS